MAWYVRCVQFWCALHIASAHDEFDDILNVSYPVNPTCPFTKIPEILTCRKPKGNVTFPKEMAKTEFILRQPKGFYIKLRGVPSDTVRVEVFGCHITKNGPHPLAVDDIEYFHIPFRQTAADRYELENDYIAIRGGDYMTFRLWYDLQLTSVESRLLTQSYRNAYTVSFKNRTSPENYTSTPESFTLVFDEK